MTKLLVTLTVLEVVIVLVVLVVYVNLVTQRLRVVSRYLGKIAMGVRAVDTHTSSIGPAVTGINKTLGQLEESLPPLVQKAK